MYFLILLVFLTLGMNGLRFAYNNNVRTDFALVMAMIANLINKPIELMINRHYINDAKRIINGLPDLTRSRTYRKLRQNKYKVLP